MTAVVTSTATVLLTPLVKAWIIEPCRDQIASKCGVPRCCRRYSSANMDIGTDLFNPKPDRSYRLLLENLDHSLVDVGWVKCPLVDDEEHLVGYKYILSGDDHKEKASIFLVKEYQGLSNQKRLLRLHKSLRAKAFKVEEVEKTAGREIPRGNSKDHYFYTTTGGTKIELEPSQISLPMVHDEKSTRTPIIPFLLNEGNKSEANDVSSSEQAKAHLKKFKEAFSTHTPANAQRFLEESLELYLKPKAKLKINDEGWFARLDFGLFSSVNFNLYYSAEHNDKP